MKLDDYEKFILPQMKSEDDSKPNVNVGRLIVVGISMLLILAAAFIVVFGV
jgi:hypothetical protein